MCELKCDLEMNIVRAECGVWLDMNLFSYGIEGFKEEFKVG